MHVEEGPDEVGGVDVEDDAVDSWSFNCWGSLICKQNKLVKIILNCENDTISSKNSI